MSEEKELGYIIVSNLIAQEKQKVGFLYRESPDNKLDSGWRVFSGQEDEGYIDNPDNFGIYSTEKILEIDPTIKDILSSPYQTAFERMSPDQPFEQVYDFDFAEEDEEE